MAVPFRCVWMVGTWSKLKRNVSWDWISTPPYIGHPTQLISGKNYYSGLLFWLALKNFLPLKYRIILFNASIKPILEYCASVWGNCNAGLLDEIFKVQKRCARIILGAPFQARTLPLLLELEWLPINQICIERRLLLLKKILDGRALDHLFEKMLSLKYHKSHDTRSRLPYRLSIPCTNSMKRMFFYNAVKLWNNVSENALVRSSEVKKFKRNFFDSSHV